MLLQDLPGLNEALRSCGGSLIAVTSVNRIDAVL